MEWDLRQQGLPEPLQLSGTDHYIVLSFKGADSGGSSSGNGSGVAPAAPAGGSRSSSRNLGSSGGEKEEGKKVRRQWESWSTEDKNTFFEGLYEHGKDFEAIQNNIALKYKKKGKPASMVKNKEQVRHFYYRTWHKITKYIDFDNGEHRGSVFGEPRRRGWALVSSRALTHPQDAFSGIVLAQLCGLECPYFVVLGLLHTHGNYRSG